MKRFACLLNGSLCFVCGVVSKYNVYLEQCDGSEFGFERLQFAYSSDLPKFGKLKGKSNTVFKQHNCH